MDTRSLYGLATELQTLENLMLDCENPELDTEAIEKKQGELLVLIQQKTDSVVGYAHYLNDGLDAIDKRIKEMGDFKKAVERRIERYEEYAKNCLKILGVTKIEGNLASITLCKPAQIVDVIDEDSIPIEFVTIEEVRKIDKAKIKDAIKEGRKVEGAGMVEGKQTIKFKTGK